MIQRVPKTTLAPVQLDQFHFGAGQFAVGGQQVVAAGVRALTGLGHGGLPDQHVIDGQGQAALVDAATHGGVALGVQVDQQGPFAQLGEGGSQVH